APPPMHELDTLQTKNRIALDDLDSLLNEHPDLSERYRARARTLNEQHSSLDVLLGRDPTSRTSLEFKSEYRSMAHQLQMKSPSAQKG
ncbi:MAG: hypothetical protein J2P36_22245, partial [Ktedonobacteraceae bacterium]|nr:hypothetical protein [Ktedonobacteraceae bacterium]